MKAANTTPESPRMRWQEIDAAYAYDGWLGPKLHADGTATLKMWSPLSAAVKVVLYDAQDHDRVVRDDIPMTKDEKGVWSVTLDEANTGLRSLRGAYYNYKVQAQTGGSVELALDPYAPSMAAFDHQRYPIGRGAIIDPSTIGPDLEFARIPGYASKTDAIIYEVHVRDFTVDPDIESSLSAPFGTFAAFKERLDYIQSLGVTHVQLLPIMSYYFGADEKAREREWTYSAHGNNYNWGYDPQSYFSVSGMYSANPRDPELRIAELKDLVAAVHERGMGVILDVVFNHTADVSIFENLMPHYYHFMDADGSPRTSFGGGRLGTTHHMARRILVDALCYWTREFNVDGFRFDMMGDHDAESIQLAYDQVKALNPNVLMIGEGWRTYVGDEGDPRQAADQDWMAHTDSVAVFSDEYRNEMKSGFGAEGEPHFISGGPRPVDLIFQNLKAQPSNFVATSPGDVVTYIEAHDNLTVYDVVAEALKKDPDIPANHEELLRRIRLGNALVLTSQGVGFLHAGQEYGRTKQWRTSGEPEQKYTHVCDADGKPFKYPYFIHDTYDSSDSLNRFEWAKVEDAQQHPASVLTRNYTAGLIALRRSTDAFRLGTKARVDERMTRVEVPEIAAEDLVVAYRCQATNDDMYYVFVNADSQTRKLTLAEDLSGGDVLVDGAQAGTEPIQAPVDVRLAADHIELAPLTVTVIRR